MVIVLFCRGSAVECILAEPGHQSFRELVSVSFLCAPESLALSISECTAALDGLPSVESAHRPRCLQLER